MELPDSPVTVALRPSARPSILCANLLFLTSLIFVFILGTVVQMWSLWPGLIVTELFLILLPTLLFAAATGSYRSELRLRWTGAGPCSIGLAIGAGIFPLAFGAGWIGERILGYSIPVPDSSWQTGLAGVGGSLVYFAASVIFAPLCEELLFRGYIMAAYERAGWRPQTVILAVAGLFTAYHLSPSRMPGVAVLAIACTYVAWRTGSVWPSVAVHMGGNGAAALLTISRGVTWTSEAPPLLLLSGIAATGIALFGLWLINGRPLRPQIPGPALSAIKRSDWWPLWVSGFIVIFVVGVELAQKIPRYR